MGCFICEKCGKIDNTACRNNFWHAHANQAAIRHNEPINVSYKPEFAYFETHPCCSDCCDGIVYDDNSGVIHPDRFDIPDKKHWSEYGKEELLEMQRTNPFSIMNAKEYFDTHPNKK